MKKIIFIVLVLKAVGDIHAQQFTNGGVEGNVNYGDFHCDGWTNVEYGDPVCTATGRDWATPDLFGVNGPSIAYGMAGIPHSGKSFASGNHAFISGDMFQEGIKQQLKGLSPGVTYTVTFWQAVIKQNNLQDTSGCWAIYFDNTLAGISEHSISEVEATDIHKIWEKREISFTATKTSHWIKFMPMDDDDDHNSNDGTNGGVRMGIDDISLRSGPVLEITVSSGPIVNMLLIDNKKLDSIHVNINDSKGDLIREMPVVTGAKAILDLTSLASGTYEIEFVSDKGSYWKEVILK
ncbi:MAG TPA: hypothetical protein VL651_12950 [Bacteroidia bacterium]|jgi:hypothetical protein|nr:hypothetical protein [Bacteroidia bacterium]